MHILQSFRICSTMTFRTYWTSSILNHETVTGSRFFAEYIYNAFALLFLFFSLAFSTIRYIIRAMASDFQADSTRNQIFEVSLGLFAEKGFDAVGVQEIVDKSGITKPTLYYYFKSKNGLLESIVNKKESEHLALLEEAAVYRHDFFNSLLEILKTEINFALKNKDYFKLRTNLMDSPGQSESFKIFFPFAEKLESLMLEFFRLSANEFGNMRGKEELYSTLFLANICSIAKKVAANTIMATEKNLYTIIHSFVYGFAD